MAPQSGSLCLQEFIGRSVPKLEYGLMLTGCEALYYTASLLWGLKDEFNQSGMQGGPYPDGEKHGR